MIWSLFNQHNKTQNKQRHPTLSNLDDILYPIRWHDRDFTSANDLLITIVENYNSSDNIDTGCHPSQEEMSSILYKNATYQDWINFTVFGRYVQRSFAIFYRQSEDVFNADMPDLLRHELMRHAQYLPSKQTLFFAGDLPLEARANRLFTTTLNPVTVFKDAKLVNTNHRERSLTVSQTHEKQSTKYIINQVTVKSSRVLGFAIRHNARTSERLRNEVMILNFQTLHLVSEKTLTSQQRDNNTIIIIRYYDLS